jgi:hypothetical protein
MIFSLLFHPERLSRLVIQQAEGGYGLQDMVQALVTSTWKAKRKSGMDLLIQMQTEQVLLTYLLSASVNAESSFAARAGMMLELQTLKTWIETQRKSATNPLLKGHFALALERMQKPAEAKPSLHREAPPGAPIGCGALDDY